MTIEWNSIVVGACGVDSIILFAKLDSIHHPSLKLRDRRQDWRDNFLLSRFPDETGKINRSRLLKE